MPQDVTRIRLRLAGLRHNERSAGMGENERVRGRASTDEVLRNVDGVVSLTAPDFTSCPMPDPGLPMPLSVRTVHKPPSFSRW